MMWMLEGNTKASLERQEQRLKWSRGKTRKNLHEGWKVKEDWGMKEGGKTCEEGREERVGGKDRGRKESLVRDQAGKGIGRMSRYKDI